MMPLPWACPTPRDLSHEFSQPGSGGKGRRIREHVRSCPSCGAEWASLDRLRSLTRALPAVALGSEELEAVRTALLVKSTPTRGRWTLSPLWLSIPAASAVLALSVLVFHGRAPAPYHATDHRADARSFLASKTRRGTVQASAAAVFTLATEQPDEVVKLREGEITVDVEPLSRLERFRVVTGDAEIEVKGTSFSVVAKDNRLMSVHVVRGVVMIRVHARPPVTLGPNERWEVPRVVDDTPTKPRSPSLHQRVVMRLSARATRTLPGAGQSETKLGSSVAPAESAFADGWQALRTGRLEAATVAFARAVTLAGDHPLAEDASFWLAVSQARIPRPVDATASLAGFIDRLPSSPRIGEAAAMLGWLLIDAGDLDGAARQFGTAARDPVNDVRRSGNEGLRAVNRRRQGGTVQWMSVLVPPMARRRRVYGRSFCPAEATRRSAKNLMSAGTDSDHLSRGVPRCVPHALPGQISKTYSTGRRGQPGCSTRTRSRRERYRVR